MAKFCKECGAPLDENTKFCKECGTPNEDYDPEKAKKERIAKIKEDAAKDAGLVDDEEPKKDEGKVEKKLTGGQIALIICGIAVVVAIIIAVIASQSCNTKDTSLTTATTTTKATTTEAETTTTKATTTAATTAVDVWNAFLGTHTAEDSSTLKITGSKNNAVVEVSIYKLATISMTGTCDDTEITCKGQDPAGNEISARVYLDASKGNIVVEFTKSTWENIPTGTTYEFPAN